MPGCINLYPNQIFEFNGIALLTDNIGKMMKTKKLSTFIISMLICLLLTGVSYANLCLNPSIEDGAGISPAGWSNFQQLPTWGIVRSNGVARTGSYSALMYGDGGWLNFFQQVSIPGAVGKKVSTRWYGYQPSAKPLTDGAKGLVNVSTDNNTMWADVHFMDGASAKDTWIEGSISFIAPDDATYVQLKAFRLHAGGESGNIYYDDFSVEVSNLKDPGFEVESELGEIWEFKYWNNALGPNQGRYEGVAHDGYWSCKIATNTINPYVRQFYSGDLSGKLITFSSWAITTNTDPLTAEAMVKIEWQPSGSFVTGSVLQAGGLVDEWTNAAVMGVAPAGTIGAYVSVFVDNPSETFCGTVFFDDTKLTIDTASAPDMPTNQAPAEGWSGMELNATLESSPYSGGEAHASTTWQVSEQSDFSSVVWESVDDTADLTQITVPAGNMKNNIKYYWRVKYKNNIGISSDWSLPTWFKTKVISQVNFFRADFSRVNDTPLGYGKWRTSHGTAITSNNMLYTVPVEDGYNYVDFQPLGINGDDVVFNINNGVNLEFNGSGWIDERVDTTNCRLKFAILNLPLDNDPYYVNNTFGLDVIFLLPDEENLVVQLLRKTGGSQNSDGGIFASTNTPWVDGAKISVSINSTDVIFSYGDSFVFQSPHGIPATDFPDWYAGWSAGNNSGGHATFFFDNIKITETGAAVNSNFVDNFTGADGAVITNSKWRVYNGTATISSNRCKLVPYYSYDAVASINVKSDFAKSFRLNNEGEALEYACTIEQIDVTETNAGSDISLKMMMLPETAFGDVDYNAAGLILNCDIDADWSTGITNLDCILYKTMENVADIQLFSNSVQYVPNAELMVRITDNNVAGYYNGSQIGSSDSGIEITNVYTDGIFPSIIAKNSGYGRGQIYLDDVRVQIVPEPAIIWIMTVLSALLCMRSMLLR